MFCNKNNYTLSVSVFLNRRSTALLTFGSERLKSNKYYENNNNNYSIVRRSRSSVASLK